MRVGAAVGNVVGLAACALVAWGTWRLVLAPPEPHTGVQITGDVYVNGHRMRGNRHPAPIGLDAVGLGCLVGANLVGFFRRYWVLPGLLLAAGTAAISGGADPAARHRVIGWVVGMILMLLGLTFVGLWRLARTAKRRVRSIETDGAAGIGTVVEVRESGATIGGDPKVYVRLRVEPQDGSAAFDASMPVLMSKRDEPVVGARYPVRFDPAHRRRPVVVVAESNTPVR